MLPASQPDEREGSEGAVACMHRACCSNCNHNQLGLSARVPVPVLHATVPLASLQIELDIDIEGA